MSIRELFVLSLKSLFLHKLRSMLATLGIVFGVGAVISMASINKTARQQSLEQYDRMGIRNIRITSRKPAGKQSQQTGQGRVVQYGMEAGELERLAANIEGVTDRYIVRKMKHKTQYRDRFFDLDILATTRSFFTINGLRIKSGRTFTDDERLNSFPVCVLGSGAASRIFHNRNAVGKEIKVGNQYVRVVGVLAGTGYAGEAAGAQQNVILLPFSMAQNRYGKYNVIREKGRFEIRGVEVHEAALYVSDVAAVDRVAKAVRSYFEREHPSGDYEITVPLELRRQREKTIRIFNIVLLSIASISLLVGGIGIMNIMLANVAERTKEIGTRRALGAKQRDIALQFLMESLTLCLSGSIAGIGLGIGLTYVITLFSDFPFGFEYMSMIAAILVSSLVGVLFGTYPALQAARMDPLEALRKE